MKLYPGSRDALVGATGYVGTTLLAQRGFGACYRSTNIDEIRGRSFELLVCAGAPAQKWLANAQPEHDRASIARLEQALADVRAERFVLVSTVDVFARPLGVDEHSAIDAGALAPYGRHRFELESFVRDRFPHALVIRLPGLVGPGLRKNVIFDLHNDNALERVDARARFQFYPMVNLWWDIAAALDAGLTLLHLTAAPLAVGEIARDAFGCEFANTLEGTPAQYDFRSAHASGGYQYDRAASLTAIRAYAQSEPKRAPLA